MLFPIWHVWPRTRRDTRWWITDQDPRTIETRGTRQSPGEDVSMCRSGTESPGTTRRRCRCSEPVAHRLHERTPRLPQLVLATRLLRGHRGDDGRRRSLRAPQRQPGPVINTAQGRSQITNETGDAPGTSPVSYPMSRPSLVGVVGEAVGVFQGLAEKVVHSCVFGDGLHLQRRVGGGG